MATNHLAIWKCHECGMVFTSPGLLAKHKGKFCPGNTVSRIGRIPPYTPRPDSPEGDIPRRNPDPQLAQLAASHGRQMEMLQGKNKDLERQRDEIRRRLEELGRRPVKEEDPSNSLFDELREQEARNQRLLEALRRELADAKQPINIIAEERFEQKKPNFTYPIYYGSSLTAEISAIRQAYLQNGGCEPEVLAQLAQMLAEAQAIEDQLRNAPKPTKVVKEKKTTDYMQTLMSLEMENERMNRELMLLQEQNMLARQRRKDDREGRIRYLWGRLRSFVNNSLYNSDRLISSVRSMSAMPHCGSGCGGSGCMSGCRGSGCGSCCCCCYRPYTSLGLYSLGATFPYASIYGYSRLSPLRYYDDDDDYYTVRRFTSFRRPLRPLTWFKKEEKEVIEEEEPEKPKTFMPFSVYPKIDKPKKQSRIVESVVSGFRPGERLMKVYSRQETDATPRGATVPLPRYSFHGAGGRVNTIYTYHTPRDGQTTTRSYSLNGIPYMWASGDPVFSGSNLFTYFSPRDGYHKTFPYSTSYKYHNLLPISGTRSSYPGSALALTSSPRNYTRMYPLSRSHSHYPTSSSLAGTLDRYPLSQPLSYRSTPTTLIYRGEQVPLDNPPLLYQGEYVPLNNPPLVYRGEPIDTKSASGYSSSVVRVLPVDRYQTGKSDDNKENQAGPKGKKAKTKKEDKKSKAEPGKKDDTPKDPLVANPQLAARFHAAGVALEAISRFNNQPRAQSSGVPPASGSYSQPPIVIQQSGSQNEGQDPLATDPGLAARLQSAAASLQLLRERQARQQAEMAEKAEKAEEKEARKDQKKEEKDKMARDMAEARLKSTQRAVHFMTELNRQEQEYYDERAKTRAANRDRERETKGNADTYKPPSNTYKPPPEEGKSKTKEKGGKKKADKKAAK